MTDRFYFTDTATATLEIVTDSVAGGDFDPSEAETVTLDTHWETFFGTDEYVKFEATVAQPIKQPYLYDGELQTFKKDESELKRAQAQLDNLPWTKGHPESKRVDSADDIRGFWKDPRWNDGQRATLYIPANDPESVRFAVDNGEVSVGFSGRLDWQEGEEATVDAVQRDMAYDHVASVENGRCPPDKGCGLHNDTDDTTAHGHVLTDTGAPTANASDAVQTQATEYTDVAVGDWVQWSSSGGTAYGKVDEVVREGTATRGKGSMGVEADPDDPAVIVEVYDNETGDSQDEYVRHKASTLSSWSGPSVNDSDCGCFETVGVGECSSGPCSCGRHTPLTAASVDEEHTLEALDLVPPESAQDAAQSALDLRDETDAMSSTGWNRAQQLAAGDELTPGDIADGTDGMANWWARHKPHTVSGDSLKRESNTPKADDHSWVAGKGWGGIPGMNWAMRMKQKIEDIRASTNDNTTPEPQGSDAQNPPAQPTEHTDTRTMTNLAELLDDNDISAEQVLDHFDVERTESPTEFYDGEPTVDELAEDFDAVDLLIDEKQSKAEELATVEDELDEYRKTEFADKADELVELTDKWEKETMLECFEDGDLTIDDIEDRIDIVEDVREDVVDDTTSVSNDSGSDSDSTDDPDFETTDSGGFDLRKQTKIGN